MECHFLNARLPGIAVLASPVGMMDGRWMRPNTGLSTN